MSRTPQHQASPQRRAHCASRTAAAARARVEPLESRRLLSVDPATLSPATISGVHFNDINSNGNRDPGEEGQPGWVVFIDETSDRSR